KKLDKYKEFIEKYSPISKPSGLFFYNALDIMRPEVVRHRIRLVERYSKPQEAEVLVLMPQTRVKPFHKADEFKKLDKAVREVFGTWPSRVHVCVYEAPFGVVPLELDESYPLSQHETAMPPDAETAAYVASQIADYLGRMAYKAAILLNDSENWGNAVLKTTRKVCKNLGIKFKYFELKGEWDKLLTKFLLDVLGDTP
ncbi:DUF5591 domain-containing protein, partial [Candidatus Bathyarchaeota archaeon]|nr:DUF5591 domain-containing protein [Candidatus Bathyarchaeota archaeon]